jgi:uroporphyrinogen decarboxylase
MDSTSVTARQRVWQAIRHEQPDRVPWFLGCTVPARQKLAAHFGPVDLDVAVGNNLVRYKARAPDAFQEIRPGVFRDEFGVVWNRTVDRDIGVVEDYQLADRTLAGYRFPDPHDPRRYAALPAFLAAHPDQFRYVSIGFSLFERAWTLRGMMDLMTDMLEAPAFVDELLDAIFEFDMGLLDEALRYDIDGVLFGDDWGQQTGLLFGARLWRRFIKPRVARLYGRVKAAGKAVMIHCCGRVQELFPDLIEVGLDVFNPFQPEVMDPVEIKRQFGDRLTFFGGMSIQRVLPFGTPADVRREAQRLIREVGQGGGFIIAPSHDMPGDIPLENMLAFVETLQAQ